MLWGRQKYIVLQGNSLYPGDTVQKNSENRNYAVSAESLYDMSMHSIKA